jgi:hypothetical protein
MTGPSSKRGRDVPRRAADVARRTVTPFRALVKLRRLPPPGLAPGPARPAQDDACPLPSVRPFFKTGRNRSRTRPLARLRVGFGTRLRATLLSGDLWPPAQVSGAADVSPRVSRTGTTDGIRGVNERLRRLEIDFHLPGTHLQRSCSDDNLLALQIRDWYFLMFLMSESDF